MAAKKSSALGRPRGLVYGADLAPDQLTEDVLVQGEALTHEAETLGDCRAYPAQIQTHIELTCGGGRVLASMLEIGEQGRVGERGQVGVLAPKTGSESAPYSI